MSTRSTTWLHAPIHVYRELTDGRYHLAVGRSVYPRLDVALWRYRR